MEHPNKGLADERDRWYKEEKKITAKIESDNKRKEEAEIAQIKSYDVSKAALYCAILSILISIVALFLSLKK